MTNENAEEIEKWVVEMTAQNEKMASALRIHYITRKKARNRADEIGISTSQFRVYVDMARQWISGRLSAFRQWY